jgi:mRNA interferase MazF
VTRGDIHVGTLQGDYGKPRPVVIIQSDATLDLESRIVCPLTTFDEPAALLRPAVDPTPENGLQVRSYVMVEKVMTVPVARLKDRIGRIDARTMALIGSALALLLEIP